MSQNRERIVISPKSSTRLNLKELVQFRDLFLVLAYRDYRVRYAQTFLGFAWALVQPFLTLIIFILIFSKAIQVDTGLIPYPLYAIVGISSWTYFSFVLSQSGSSIIGAQEMVKKIYFPRLIIPLSKAAVGFIDYSITLSMFIVLMIYYNFFPGMNGFYFPLFFFLLVILSLGVGIWFSALTIRFRDFQHVLPFIVQFGLYATPVAYPSTLVPDQFKWIYYLNPMAGIIDGFRWCLLNGPALTIHSYLSYALVIIVFISSIIYFKKMEKSMADIV